MVNLVWGLFIGIWRLLFFFELFVWVSTNNLELVVQDLGADGFTERRGRVKTWHVIKFVSGSTWLKHGGRREKRILKRLEKINVFRRDWLLSHKPRRRPRVQLWREPPKWRAGSKAEETLLVFLKMRDWKEHRKASCLTTKKQGSCRIFRLRGASSKMEIWKAELFKREHRHLACWVGGKVLFCL